jgi:hypothetical protein
VARRTEVHLNKSSINEDNKVGQIAPGALIVTDIKVSSYRVAFSNKAHADIWMFVGPREGDGDWGRLVLVKAHRSLPWDGKFYIVRSKWLARVKSYKTLGGNPTDLQRITTLCESSHEFNSALNVLHLHVAHNELFFEEESVMQYLYGKLVIRRNSTKIGN